MAPADRYIEGVVEMMLDATQKYTEPLTDGRLLAWRAALFPTGRRGMTKIIVGAWREDGASRIHGRPVHATGQFAKVKLPQA